MKNKAKLLKNLKKLSITVNNNIDVLDELIQADENANNPLDKLARDKFKFIALRTDIKKLENELSKPGGEDTISQESIYNQLNKIQNKINSITTTIDLGKELESDKKLKIALPKLEKSNTQSIRPSLLTAASALRDAMQELHESMMNITTTNSIPNLTMERNETTLTQYNKEHLSNGKKLQYSATEFHELQSVGKVGKQTTRGNYFTAPLEAISIDIPAADPITQTIYSHNVAIPTKPENTKWTDIRLKTMNSKWGKADWGNKKFNPVKNRQFMSSDEINALVIDVSMQKLQSLQATDKNKAKYANRQEPETKQALDAKIHLYVKTGWDSAKNPDDENVLTISQSVKPIFEVRPEENKIQFLIPDTELTAEHRVAALEMFQQMCRIKGAPQEVKINCGDPTMKGKFVANAELAGITAVGEFKSKPNL